MIRFLSDIKNIKFNYNLGKKTWFGSGGNTTFFVEINSESNLQKLVKLLLTLFQYLFWVQVQML